MPERIRKYEYFDEKDISFMANRKKAFLLIFSVI